MKIGDQISHKLCWMPCFEISALKGDGIKEAANKAVELAKKKTLNKNNSMSFQRKQRTLLQMLRIS